jgi:hypothetical protein
MRLKSYLTFRSPNESQLTEVFGLSIELSSVLNVLWSEWLGNHFYCSCSVPRADPA